MTNSRNPDQNSLISILRNPSSPQLQMSPELPTIPDGMTSGNKKKGASALLAVCQQCFLAVWHQCLLVGLPQCFALGAVPASIYTAQKHRAILSNITVVGPYVDSFLKYTPSLEETWTLSWPTAIVKAAYGPLVYILGNHPVASNVFRDISKAFSVLRGRLSGLDLGSSDYKYGVGNVVTALLKPLCKAAIIIPATDKETGGLNANLVCEPLAHAPMLVERKLQNINKTAALQATFPEYLRLAYNHTNIVDLTLRSVMAVPSKGIAPRIFMDRVWIHFQMHVALGRICYGFSFAVQKGLVYLLTGKAVDFKPEAGVYSHIKQGYIIAAQRHFLAVPFVVGIICASHFTAALSIEFYNTYVLVSILRPIQYGVDWATEQVAGLVPSWSQPLLEPLGTTAILSVEIGYLVMKVGHVGVRSAATISGPASLVITAVDVSLNYFEYQSEHQLSHALVVFSNCVFVTSFAFSLPVGATVCLAGTGAYIMYGNNAQVYEEEQIAYTEINAEIIPVQTAGAQQPEPDPA